MSKNKKNRTPRFPYWYEARIGVKEAHATRIKPVSGNLLAHNDIDALNRLDKLAWEAGGTLLKANVYEKDDETGELELVASTEAAMSEASENKETSPIPDKLRQHERSTERTYTPRRGTSGAQYDDDLLEWLTLTSIGKGTFANYKLKEK